MGHKENFMPAPWPVRRPGRNLQAAQKPLSSRPFPADRSSRCRKVSYRSVTAAMPPLADPRSRARRRLPRRPAAAKTCKKLGTVHNGCRRPCRHADHRAVRMASKQPEGVDRSPLPRRHGGNGPADAADASPLRAASVMLAAPLSEIVAASWTGRRTRRNGRTKGSSGRDERRHREASWPSDYKDGREAIWPRRHSQRGRVPGRRLHRAAQPPARAKSNLEFHGRFRFGVGIKGCFQAFSPSENVPLPPTRNVAQTPCF